MTEDRLQHQRYELKYLIDERTALKVRDFVQCYLMIDEYGAMQPNLSYPVHSLYLDSDGLDTYWDTINGNKNRFKLRLRYYDDRPDSPIFLEIKRRMNNIILKQRGAVRRAAASLILGGHLLRAEELFSSDPEHLLAVQEFVRLMLQYEARPKLHIAYLREAWENADDNSVLVTMDRQVLSAPNHSPTTVVRSRNPHSVFGKQVILELKYTNRFPNWFRELVQTFNCVQGGAAKYAEGIFVQGEDWATRPLRHKSAEELVSEFLFDHSAAAPQVG